jgi:glycolate oxidase iron-sulfur subunit
LPTTSALRAALTVFPAEAPALPASGDTEIPSGPSQPHVAVFPGCVASVEDAAAENAAMALLRAAGYKVSRLPSLCCGALDFHGGEAKGAEHAAESVRKAWQTLGADQLVTVTPGCLGALRHALPGVTVTDPFSLLASRIDQLHFRPLPRRVALHLPCTQINVARNEASLVALLRRVPELDVATVPRPPYCCGAAGSHMLEFPERAARLREDTLHQIASLAPQQLLSSNIGCRLHLAAGMDANGHSWPHLHPLTLLAQQLSEVSP